MPRFTYTFPARRRPVACGDARRRAREQPGGERVVGVVGERERVVEVVGAQHREHRSEDLVGRDPRARVVGDDDRRPDVPPAVGHVVALDDDVALFVRERLVSPHAFVRVGVDERSAHRAQVLAPGRPERSAAAPARRSTSSSNTGSSAITRDAAEHFWPAYANALCDDRRDRDVEVGVGVDDDRVLAAHLGDDALDVPLPRSDDRRALDDLRGRPPSSR